MVTSTLIALATAPAEAVLDEEQLGEMLFDALFGGDPGAWYRRARSRDWLTLLDHAKAAGQVARVRDTVALAAVARALADPQRSALSRSHLRELASAGSLREVRSLAQRAHERGWTVRQLRAARQDAAEARGDRIGRPTTPPEERCLALLRQAAEALRRSRIRAARRTLSERREILDAAIDELEGMLRVLRRQRASLGERY